MTNRDLGRLRKPVNWRWWRSLFMVCVCCGAMTVAAVMLAQIAAAHLQ